jgi:ribosomal protein S18 acetylase RimI-like enzyme
MFGTQHAAPTLTLPAGPTAIRPVVPADVPALRQFFTELSKQSRYQRFFGPIGTPNPPLLDLLAGGPSHVDAVVATAGGLIIGHAMAADQICPDGEHRTDIGVVVADAWQGHGMGVALIRTMIDRAQARGVTLVVMDVLHDNYRALAMITHHWPAARAGQARDFATLHLDLPALTSGHAASLRSLPAA